MRIFHGLRNIAGMPSIMAKAERSYGLQSLSVCFSSGHFNFVPDIVEGQIQSPQHLVNRITKYVANFDVFVFYFGHSLGDDTLADIPLLKQMGKTIVFYFCGCDIRQSKETIKKYKFSACKECWPQICNANRDLALDMAVKYADSIWVSTPELLEFVPGSQLFMQPIDLSFFPYQAHRGIPPLAKKEKIRIVHAPTNSLLKGTKYVVAAIEALQREGVPVELLLLENLSHAELMQKIKEADLGIDQILCGSYGTFSAELMAQGIPMICYIREDLVKIYPKDLPIVSANPETIKDVIKHMVENQDQWPALSLKSRKYVEKNHDSKILAVRSIKTYQASLAKMKAKNLEPQKIADAS